MFYSEEMEIFKRKMRKSSLRHLFTQGEFCARRVVKEMKYVVWTSFLILIGCKISNRSTIMVLTTSPILNRVATPPGKRGKVRKIETDTKKYGNIIISPKA